MSPEIDVKKLVMDAQAKKDAAAKPDIRTNADADMKADQGAEEKASLLKLIAELQAKLAAKPSPAVDNGSPGCFKVKLKDCDALIVRAKDRLDAIKVYRGHCGILSTVHDFDVEGVEEPKKPPHARGHWLEDGSTPQATPFPVKVEAKA